MGFELGAAVSTVREPIQTERLLGLLPRKAAAIFSRGEEGFHHLGVFEVAIERVEFIKPEIIAGEVGVAA